jgi:3-dehydroquinate synthase
MSSHETLSVQLGERSYDILVGSGLLGEAGKHIAPVLHRPRTVIVTDETVAGLHLDALGASLSHAGIDHDAVVLPPGEQTKSFRHLEDLLNELLAKQVERSDTIIAFGGGVIGDLTGFAASILRRGVDFIQIPTTLLSQVDSSVGGKTGINTRFGKNLAGAFHQPRLVLADVAVLDTLPRRQLLAGYAEVMKYGLIDDAEFFAWLEGHGASLLEGDRALRQHAIAKSCRAKAAIVAQDEKEQGARALLNLGHTFGHALEAETGYGDRLLHGEAVAIGTMLAFELSAHLGLCSEADAARVRRHMSAVGFPSLAEVFRGAPCDPAVLIGHMSQDKKVVAGQMMFVLARGIGQCFLTKDVSETDLLTVLSQEMVE